MAYSHVLPLPAASEYSVCSLDKADAHINMSLSSLNSFLKLARSSNVSVTPSLSASPSRLPTTQSYASCPLDNSDSGCPLAKSDSSFPLDKSDFSFSLDKSDSGCPLAKSDSSFPLDKSDCGCPLDKSDCGCPLVNQIPVSH